MSAFNTRDFKRLRAQYYQTLKDEGFKDIERLNGNLIDHQAVSDFSQRIAFKSDLFEEVRDHYLLASSLIHVMDFESERDKTIWEMHSDGASSRTIARHVDFDQSWVCEKIRRIRKYLMAKYFELKRLEDEKEEQEMNESRG